jgi:hypothetical protein
MVNPLLVAQAVRGMSNKYTYILSMIGFAILILLLTLIPCIKLPLVSEPYCILSEATKYHIWFWFFLFLFVIIQFVFFYGYTLAFRFIRDKAMPYMKNVENIPSKIQYMLYKR